MKKMFCLLLSGLLLNSVHIAHAEQNTHRKPLLSNNHVTVWKTTIYPSQPQQLPMHNHKHDRVVIALTNGNLLIKNDKGKTHKLALHQDHAYYLTKDKATEQHVDINTGTKPIKVIVVELNR